MLILKQKYEGEKLQPNTKDTFCRVHKEIKQKWYELFRWNCSLCWVSGKSTNGIHTGIVKHCQALMTVQRKSSISSFLFCLSPLLYRACNVFLWPDNSPHHPLQTAKDGQGTHKYPVKSPFFKRQLDKAEAAAAVKLLRRKYTVIGFTSLSKCQSGGGGCWVPITPHICEFSSNYHDSLMSVHEKRSPVSLLQLLRVEVVFVTTSSPYLLWQAAQTLGCHRWQWAQSHFHLSGWSHIAGPDLQVRQNYIHNSVFKRTRKSLK